MAPKPPKAYKNPEFLNSANARVVRLVSEYIEPRTRFLDHQVNNSIVFFGSARFTDMATAQTELSPAETAHRDNPSAEHLQQLRKAQARVRTAAYYEDARELARLLTEWSMEQHTLEDRYYICSGGGPGIMEAANRGASEAKNGESIGLNISLPMEQDCNPYITDHLNFEFHYFFMRKFWFMYLAKALVVFPGGFGTLDELFESLTLIQTEKMNKGMPVVLYAEDYWRKIINLEALAEEGTINPEDLKLFHFCSNPAQAFNFLTARLQP